MLYIIYFAQQLDEMIQKLTVNVISELNNIVTIISM